MSYKGPSVSERGSGQGPHPHERGTGTGDAPGRRLLDSGPSHRITRQLRRSLGEPVPVVRTLVSEPSRAPRRECVGEVLCPVSGVPQGVAAEFLHIPRVPACRPQPRPVSSPDRSGSSTSLPQPLWTKLGPTGAPKPVLVPEISAHQRGFHRPAGEIGCPQTPASRADSYAAAISSSRRSWPWGATSCRPTGQPSSVVPAGTEIAGQPVTLIR